MPTAKSLKKLRSASTAFLEDGGSLLNGVDGLLRDIQRTLKDLQRREEILVARENEMESRESRLDDLLKQLSDKVVGLPMASQSTIVPAATEKVEESKKPIVEETIETSDAETTPISTIEADLSTELNELQEAVAEVVAPIEETTEETAEEESPEEIEPVVATSRPAKMTNPRHTFQHRKKRRR